MFSYQFLTDKIAPGVCKHITRCVNPVLLLSSGQQYENVTVVWRNHNSVCFPKALQSKQQADPKGSADTRKEPWADISQAEGKAASDVKQPGWTGLEGRRHHTVEVNRAFAEHLKLYPECFGPDLPIPGFHKVANNKLPDGGRRECVVWPPAPEAERTWRDPVTDKHIHWKMSNTGIDSYSRWKKTAHPSRSEDFHEFVKRRNITWTHQVKLMPHKMSGSFFQRCKITCPCSLPLFLWKQPRHTFVLEKRVKN